jgi:F0F1-type ATP synthase membrane subunit b/b'
MKQQLKAESSDIAAEMVRQILSTSLTEADHRNLIKSAISRIDKSS